MYVFAVVTISAYNHSFVDVSGSTSRTAGDAINQSLLISMTPPWANPPIEEEDIYVMELRDGKRINVRSV